MQRSYRVTHKGRRTEWNKSSRGLQIRKITYAPQLAAVHKLQTAKLSTLHMCLYAMYK